MHELLEHLMILVNRIGGFWRTNGHAKMEPSPVPVTALEQRQQLLAHHVKLVAKKISFGLFVAGPGGLGKSRTIQNTLTAEGIEPVLLNSHITPLALYKSLYEHRRGRIIWLDDCDSCYANMQVLGLLRSALWGQGDRLVTYNSTQLDDLPSRFVFDSRIIFCANTLPQRNAAFQAVVSRVDVFTLDASNEEILEQMRTLAANGYRSLNADQCQGVVDFIQDHCGSRTLSMRLYEPSLRKYEYAVQAGIDWRDLIRCQLDQLGTPQASPDGMDPLQSDLTAIAEAMAVYPDSVRLQESHWCHVTGKSRASFFRCKKRHEELQASNSNGANHDGS